MNTTLDVAYVAATAVAVVYVVVALGVASRGRSDVIKVMAGDAFAYAMATALAAVIVGRLLRADEVNVSTLVIIAIPFGMAATAFHALARRDATARNRFVLLESAALATAIVCPFALGVAGWA